MIPAIMAASVALIVAVLTPAVNSWRARRQAIADLFDDALAALLIAQTARHHPSGAAGYFSQLGWDRNETREFSLRMQQDGVARFLATQEDARVALARLETFVPEIRREVTAQWEIREDQESVIREMLSRRRAEAIKSERLFRTRRTPRPLSN